MAVVKQLYDRKRDFRSRAPAPIAEFGRPPVYVLVAQNREADYFPIIQLVGRRVVVEHPACEVFFIRTPNLDVNEQPAFAAVVQPDLEEHVGDLFAGLSVAHDLLKFLVQGIVPRVQSISE